VIENRINGTIIIFNKRMNIVPSGATKREFSLKIRAKIVPNAMAINTRQ
jgi:hypothetical protein